MKGRDDCSSSKVLAPHMEDLNYIPGSVFQLQPVPRIGEWGVEKEISQSISLSFSLSLHLSLSFSLPLSISLPPKNFQKIFR